MANYIVVLSNVGNAHSIKFIDSQLHLLDQKVLYFDARFCARFFSCLASIPQFYSQFLANQYRLALEYLKLKRASSFLPSLSGGALLIKLSTHPENFRIISYNLHFYFWGQNCCNICNCHHHLQYEGILRWTQLQNFSKQFESRDS